MPMVKRHRAPGGSKGSTGNFAAAQPTATVNSAINQSVATANSPINQLVATVNSPVIKSSGVPCSRRGLSSESSAFSPIEVPTAGLVLSVHPPWLEIPFVQGELFFECTLFLYSVLALFLQYLNLYKTLWWLPKSYWHFSMKFHHVNPYFLSCVGLLLGLRVTKCFWTTMSELVFTWTEGASRTTQIIFLVIEYIVVKLPVMTMILTSFFFSFSRIVREFPFGHVVFFALPPGVYVLLFHHEIWMRLRRMKVALLNMIQGKGSITDVMETFSEDDSGLLDLQSIAHMCNNVSSRIREEVDLLLDDVLLRLKKCLFAGFSTAFLSIGLPLVFVPFKTSVDMPQQMLIHESWEVQMAGIVFCTAFAHYITYLFPLPYFDLIHRSALHLGRWEVIPNPPQQAAQPRRYVIVSYSNASVAQMPSLPPQLWSPISPPYPHGEVVQLPCGTRYKAVSCSEKLGTVAADPSDPGQAKFAQYCSHHLSLVNILVYFQLMLIGGQFWLLILTTEWQHIITLVLLMFANYLLLAKLFKDRIILSRIYDPSEADLELIREVQMENTMEIDEETSDTGGKDVSAMFSILGKPVKVTTCDSRGKNKMQYGNVYTIDPITGSLFLVVFDIERKAERLVWIPSESLVAVDEVVSSSGEDTFPAGCVAASPVLSKAFLELFNRTSASDVDVHSEKNHKRKENLCHWMKRNCLPVTEQPDGSLLIYDLVRVNAPYGADDCMCENAIVLQRIRKLIQCAPDEDTPPVQH